MVVVGDRWTLTQAQLDSMAATPGIGWITALRSESLRRLANEGVLQRSLFDEGISVGREEGRLAALRENVRHMYQEGFSVEVIARALAISEKDVHDILGL